MRVRVCVCACRRVSVSVYKGAHIRAVSGHTAVEEDRQLDLSDVLQNKCQHSRGTAVKPSQITGFNLLGCSKYSMLSVQIDKMHPKALSPPF